MRIRSSYMTWRILWCLPELLSLSINRPLKQMTVFRPKTFKRAGRKSRKSLRRKTVRRTKKQAGGYVPYRAIPKGAVFADVMDWDDSKEVSK